MALSRRIQRTLILLVSIFALTCVLNFFKHKNSIVYLKNPTIPKSKIGEIVDSTPFDISTIRTIKQESILQNYRSFTIEHPEIINWDKFAYVFYATSPDQLLPVFINVKELRKLETQAQIHLIYSFHDVGDDSRTERMLKLLETRYSTKLEKIEPIRPTADDFSSWSDSFTKLYAFKLVQYDRIVYLDADSVIRKHMDELFLLPPALIAAPLNYIDYRKIYKPTIWDDLGILDKLDDIPPTPFEYELITQDLYHSIIENELEFNDHYFWSLYAALQTLDNTIELSPHMKLASYLMVITPDLNVFEWISKVISKRKQEEYDMEIINNVFNINEVRDNNFHIRQRNGDIGNSNPWLQGEIIPAVLILPHNTYSLLSGEFRHPVFQHSAYLVSPADIGYLEKESPSLSFQRALKGIHYKDIEEVLEIFPEVPYWDWGWRFDIDGKCTDIEELGINEKIGGNGEEDEKIDLGLNIQNLGWDSKKILENSHYIHWSDWPLDKPWRFTDDSEKELEKMFEVGLNKCRENARSVFLEIDLNENVREKIKGRLDNELNFALRNCDESLNVWKKIYQHYGDLVNFAIEEIK